jgi:hypothetical protein
MPGRYLPLLLSLAGLTGCEVRSLRPADPPQLDPGGELTPPDQANMPPSDMGSATDLAAAPLLPGQPPLFTIVRTNVPNCGGVMTHGDFNGDGKDDIALACFSGVQVLLGHGDGTFDNTSVGAFSSTLYSSFATAVLDGNPRPALIAGQLNSYDVDIGTMTGATWSHKVIHFAGDVLSITVGDFNEDGKQDIAIIELPSTANAAIGVALSDGAGGFTVSAINLAGAGSAIQAGDFDGDKHLDLFIEVGGNLQFFQGDGTGKFQASTVVNLPNSLNQGWGMAVGDVDRDGRADLLAGADTGAYLVTDHNGLAGRSVYATDPHVTVALGAIADLNNDGRPDLIAGGTFGSVLLLQLDNGDFSAPIALAGDIHPLDQLLVSDVNGDRLNDVVLHPDNYVDVLLQHRP